MSDRKYRQRGYQDEPRPERQEKREPVPREMRAPSVPGFKRISRCRRCGQPGPAEIAADTRCARCGTELRSCLQCAHFDTGSRFECAQPIAARIAVKDVRNDCGYFEPHITIERETGTPSTSGARQAFDDLFK
jgi:hypothetical protein